MSKKISVGAAIMLMGMTAAVTITITVLIYTNVFNLNINSLTQRQSLFNNLTSVDAFVRANYIGKIDETTLQDNLKAGYMAGIGDKHGFYYDAATFKQVQLGNEGKGLGIGVSVVKADDGNIKVVSVSKGSPADTKAVMVADEITIIGGQKVTDLGYDKAVELLHGGVGTKADFAVLRAGKQVIFSIVRSQYELQTVIPQMINNIGYIKITEFDSNTDAQFSAALDSLKSKGAQGIIFDVRNNPGGELTVCENMLNKLLPKGPIVKAVDKSGKVTVLKNSDGVDFKLPMAVLTNGNSASAAELFTAALRDYNKAKSVGTKTYGKGTMQQTFRLNDGSAITLTVAYFNPPKSPNFDGKGIAPDVEVELAADKINHFYELSQNDDDQLQAAIGYIDTLIS
jgi:carboxyl-terminal processing protease